MLQSGIGSRRPGPCSARRGSGSRCQRCSIGNHSRDFKGDGRVHAHVRAPGHLDDVRLPATADPAFLHRRCFRAMCRVTRFYTWKWRLGTDDRATGTTRAAAHRWPARRTGSSMDRSRRKDGGRPPPQDDASRFSYRRKGRSARRRRIWAKDPDPAHRKGRNPGLRGPRPI